MFQPLPHMRIAAVRELIKSLGVATPLERKLAYGTLILLLGEAARAGKNDDPKRLEDAEIGVYHFCFPEEEIVSAQSLDQTIVSLQMFL